MPLFRRLRPLPLLRPTINGLEFPDQAALEKRSADVQRVTQEALGRAGAVVLTPGQAEFAVVFAEFLSTLTTEPGVPSVLEREAALHQVNEAVKLGAAFAAGVDHDGPVTKVDPVTSAAKTAAAYRHTHFEPKDLAIMGWFSAQCGFYLPLAVAKPEDVLPSSAEVVDAANRAGPGYEAAREMLDLIWDKWVGE